MRKVYIYALVDPVTKERRYVGKTVKEPRLRLYDHLFECKQQKEHTHKNNWLRSLLNVGLKPEIEILEIVNESNWQQKEIEWIATLSKTCNLTNATPGGEGYSHTEESKEKIRRANQGSKSSSAKLNEELVLEILYKYADGHTTVEQLASEYGITFSPIARILSGKRWNHVYSELPKEIKDKIEYQKTKGFHKIRKRWKLTPMDVVRIREIYSKGKESYASIGRMFGVTNVCIGHIITGKTWSSVT